MRMMRISGLYWFLLCGYYVRNTSACKPWTTSTTTTTTSTKSTTTTIKYISAMTDQMLFKL